jgi:hypothetical protein
MSEGRSGVSNGKTRPTAARQDEVALYCHDPIVFMVRRPRSGRLEARAMAVPAPPQHALPVVVEFRRQKLPGGPAKPMGCPEPTPEKSPQRLATRRLFSWHGIRMAVLDALVARAWF